MLGRTAVVGLVAVAVTGAVVAGAALGYLFADHLDAFMVGGKR